MTAILTALSLIAFIIEGLFPPLLLPGAKMGISNIFTLTALVALGPVEAFIVVCAKCLLGSFFSGFSAIMYSLPAGLFSLAAEWMCLRLVFPRISVTAISVSGAALHNIAQCLIFAAASGEASTLSYLPYLMLIGIGSGLIVGLAVTMFINKSPERLLSRVSTYNQISGGQVEGN